MARQISKLVSVFFALTILVLSPCNCFAEAKTTSNPSHDCCPTEHNSDQQENNQDCCVDYRCTEDLFNNSFQDQDLNVDSVLATANIVPETSYKKLNKELNYFIPTKNFLPIINFQTSLCRFLI